MEESGKTGMTKRERQKARRQERLATKRTTDRRDRRMRTVRWTVLILIGAGALAVPQMEALLDKR